MLGTAATFASPVTLMLTTAGPYCLAIALNEGRVTVAAGAAAATAAGAGFACAMHGSDKPSCEYPTSAAVTMPAATSPRTSAFCFIC